MNYQSIDTESRLFLNDWYQIWTHFKSGNRDAMKRAISNHALRIGGNKKAATLEIGAIMAKTDKEQVNSILARIQKSGVLGEARI